MSQDSVSHGFRLTFAELEAISGDEPGWPRVRHVLGFDVPLDKTVIQGCGMASLLARGYATVEDQRILMPNPLIEITKRLREGTHWIGVMVITDGAAVSTVYGVNDAGTGRVYTGTVAPGVIEILPFVDTVEPAAQLEEIITSHLAADSVMLAIKPENCQPMLIRRQGDAWSLGDPSDPSADYTPATKDAVLAQLDEILKANLP